MKKVYIEGIGGESQNNKNKKQKQTNPYILQLKNTFLNEKFTRWA